MPSRWQTTKEESESREQPRCTPGQPLSILHSAGLEDIAEKLPAEIEGELNVFQLQVGIIDILQTQDIALVKLRQNPAEKEAQHLH